MSNGKRLGLHPPAIALLVLGLAGVGLVLLSPEPSPEGKAHNPLELGGDPSGVPGILIDYDLYVVHPDGSESLAETTNYDVGKSANATQGYRLRGEERYVPLFVQWDNLTRPRLLVDHVLGSLDATALAPGSRVDAVVKDAVGSESELLRGTVPRVHGPYPVYYELTRDEFKTATGHEPEIGERANTTAFFSASVDDFLENGRVRMRVNVNESEAVVSRTLASLFRINVSEDGREFWLTLTPLRDSLFNVETPNPVLGLDEGTYVWGNVTEEFVEYLGHPEANPYLVGLDFRIEIAVHRSDPPPGGFP